MKIREYTSFFKVKDIEHVEHLISVYEDYYDEIHLIADSNNKKREESEKFYRLDYTYDHQMINSKEFVQMFGMLTIEGLITSKFTLFSEKYYLDRIEKSSVAIEDYIR